MSEEFVVIYQELLEDLPNEVLVKAIRECLLRCRFYPTIAEIREKAEPILQEYNLEHRRLIADDARGKCKANVKWDEKREPHCPLEGKPEQCRQWEHGCLKWDAERPPATPEEIARGKEMMSKLKEKFKSRRPEDGEEAGSEEHRVEREPSGNIQG